MANWPNAVSAHLSRLMGLGRVTASTEIADLRKRHDLLAAGFGPTPPGTQVEKAQLGQIKGEWVRVAETHPRRLILYLHGGGYVAGSPESHRPLVARLCKMSSAAALSLDYRLGPEFPFPAGLRDVVDTYRFLIAKGFPADSIVIAGDGSGGGLAIAALTALRNAQMPMPAACVAISPWADLTLSGWSMIQNATTDSVLSWEFLFVCARYYLKGANPADAYASPVFGNLRDFPPIMVHAGSLEVLKDDASRIGELAASSHVPVSVEVYDGMPHVFQAFPSIPESKVSLARLGQFIRSRTPQRAEAPEPGKNVKRGS